MTIKQNLISGVFSGAILGFVIANGFNTVGYLELWMRGLLDDPIAIPVRVSVVHITLLCTVVVGLARFLFGITFKNVKSKILSWQITGSISIVLFYFGILTSAMLNLFFSPDRFRWIDTPLFDLAYWIIVSVIVLVFNLIYAIALKLIYAKKDVLSV